jgi:hypothetical protein
MACEEYQGGFEALCKVSIIYLLEDLERAVFSSSFKIEDVARDIGHPA